MRDASILCVCKRYIDVTIHDKTDRRIYTSQIACCCCGCHAVYNLSEIAIMFFSDCFNKEYSQDAAYISVLREVMGGE
jgi:hypothetical protein